MKRTTIDCEPEFEARLKREIARREQPGTERIRAAVHAFLGHSSLTPEASVGAISSRGSDSAERCRLELITSVFGLGPLPSPSAPTA